jgi:murein DD-endopeptidase MepM/ murein hydrolase activator NlpD
MVALIVFALVACVAGTYALAFRPTVAKPEQTAVAAATPVQPRSSDTIELEQRHLELPVLGVDRSKLVPSFDQARSGHVHEAIDIHAPRGTPVVAVEDGTVAKLFDSKRGGLTIYQFDPSQRFAYYYAHLDRYADDLKEGRQVARGQVLGYVGSTGNANPTSPHLHFTIFRLGPERRWWEGVAIDPYPIFTAS